VQHPIDAAELQIEVQDARLHASPKRIESWWWD